MLREITSRDNAHYRALVRLQRAGGASRRDGVAVIEGDHLVEVCLARAPDRIRGVFLRESAAVPRVAPATCPLWRLPATLFDRASLMPAPPDVMALVDMAASGTPARHGFILALDHVQDPGNVGTLIRTAAAAGCSEVWVDRGSAAAWSGKTLRAAQGAHFQIPVHDGVDLSRALESFRGQRWATLPAANPVPTVSLDALSARAADFDGVMSPEADLVVVVSNEGAGLSPALEPVIDRGLAIPMSAGVESLNAAVAGSIALYALRGLRGRVSTPPVRA